MPPRIRARSNGWKTLLFYESCATAPVPRQRVVKDWMPPRLAARPFYLSRGCSGMDWRAVIRPDAEAPDVRQR